MSSTQAHERAAAATQQLIRKAAELTGIALALRDGLKERQTNRNLDHNVTAAIRATEAAQTCIRLANKAIDAMSRITPDKP